MKKRLGLWICLMLSVAALMSKPAQGKTLLDQYLDQARSWQKSRNLDSTRFYAIKALNLALAQNNKTAIAQAALLKAFTPKEVTGSAEQFATHVKDLRIPVTGLRPVGEAISTVGGIPVEALNPDFSLKGHPHLHTVGEMVDWDAPTGGFLLQGCFAMGRLAAVLILPTLEK